MTQYRKKPVVIEAVQWDGDSETANQFLGEDYGVDWEYAAQGDSALVIPTLEGRMRANPGDWIIRGVKGEFYPIKDAIFRETYEEIG